MSDPLEQQFHHAMLGLYDAAADLKPPFRSQRFLNMVRERGGRAAAAQLLTGARPSDGFTELFLRGKDKLKLTVEYLALQDEWKSLFSEEQLAIARQRLIEVECPLPGETAS
ncbi:hypothetical protein ACSFBF_10230 [Variovorax sp. ZT5P49]|uniref:hypothetical protein n=1 Tax=Variovorax sp. ZT5P49 TaxID=3443733 RepID=UPI003F452E78